jgi:regulator of sigma E protease
MLITIVSFVLVLGVLVFLHELGHYWVARRHGIEVVEFGMGYPPRIWKLFTYDGTDFTLNAIPFGGFARMKGEDAGDMSPGSFNAASRMGRALTLLAGPAMNALIAVILFAASFMAGFPAPAGRPQVTGVLPGSMAAAAGIQPGDVLLELDSQPVQVNPVPDMNYKVMARPGQSDSGQSQLLFSRDGQIQEVQLPEGSTSAELLSGIEYAPVLSTEITLVAEGSPAQTAGIEPGDLVYSVNGETISLDATLSDVILAHAGEQVDITVLRGTQWESLQATPRVDPPPGEGALGVGIGLTNTLARLPLLASLREGVKETVGYAALILKLPVMLVMGQLAPSEAQLSGPVGIARFVGGAVNATIDTGLWFPVLRLTAVLSAALAITNMLPIPALDGGRLLFIAIEALRGRRINPEREGLVHMVGFVVLIGLLLFITVRDIMTPQQGIDWVSILGQ